MTDLVLDVQHDYFNSAEILAIFGAPTRLKILQLIASSKVFTISDIASTLECGIANVSHHIQILEDAGLVNKLRMKDGSQRKSLTNNYNKVIVKL